MCQFSLPQYLIIPPSVLFNNTSLSILKVLLASLWLPPSFAMLSESPAHVLPCCAFSFKRYAVFLSTVFEHLHYFYLFEMTSYPLFSFIWHLFFPHLLHSTYVTYHKWSLTICDGCFDTLKSSKMRS